MIELSNAQKIPFTNLNVTVCKFEFSIYKRWSMKVHKNPKNNPDPNLNYNPNLKNRKFEEKYLKTLLYVYKFYRCSPLNNGRPF